MQNNSIYYATRISPFENLYRFNPEIRNLPIWDESQKERVLAATERARDMQATSEALKKRWVEAQEAQVRNQNSRQKAIYFAVGNIVLLSSRNLKLLVPKKKLGARYLSLFRIRDAIGKQASYWLCRPYIVFTMCSI